MRSIIIVTFFLVLVALACADHTKPKQPTKEKEVKEGVHTVKKRSPQSYTIVAPPAPQTNQLYAQPNQGYTSFDQPNSLPNQDYMRFDQGYVPVNPMQYVNQDPAASNMGAQTMPSMPTQMPSMPTQMPSMPPQMPAAMPAMPSEMPSAMPAVMPAAMPDITLLPDHVQLGKLQALIDVMVQVTKFSVFKWGAFALANLSSFMTSDVKSKIESIINRMTPDCS